MPAMSKKGVIIANTGSPDSPNVEAVKEYLAVFLADSRIRPMKSRMWDALLKHFILPKRSPYSASKYAEIWTDAGSPLSSSMQALACSLKETFASQSLDYTVRCGMSYGNPSISDALSHLHDAGCEEVCILPLYPQSAFSTTLVVKDKVHEALGSLDWNPALSFVNEYSSNPSYIQAIARSIEEAGFDATCDDRLVFAFHSIPMSDIRNGDEYGELSHASAQSIASELGLADQQWDIGFQCRFDKSRAWLGPSITQVIQKMLQDCHLKDGRLFVVAPNFAVDCLETLYDIDFELRSKVANMRDDAFSTDSFVYVPCLNASQMHVELLYEVIRENMAL